MPTGVAIATTQKYPVAEPLSVSRDSLGLALAEWAALTGPVVVFDGHSGYLDDGGDHLWRWPDHGGDQSIYFARGPARSVKAGVSGNPNARLIGLNSPHVRAARVPWLGSDGEHRLIACIPDCSRWHETALHDLLAIERINQGGKTGRSEWYRGPNVELLVALVCARAERLA